MTYKPLFVSGTCLQGSDNKENQTHGVSFACHTAPASLPTRQGLGTSRTRMTSSSQRQGSSEIRNVLAARLTSRESDCKESSRNCSFIPAVCWLQTRLLAANQACPEGCTVLRKKKRESLVHSTNQNPSPEVHVRLVSLS